jgi:hypothetical protein
MFQNSVVNGGTTVQAIPNGTGNTAAWEANNASDAANSGGLRILSTTTDARVDANIRGTGTYLPMTFYTGGSERLRIDTSGNVGIGTSAPNTHLHVYGGGTTSSNWTNGDPTGAALFLQDSGAASGSGGQLLFGSAFGIHAGIKGIVVNGTGPAGELLFQTRATSGNVNERMRIDQLGNVGIGTSSPNGKLNVLGGIGLGVALTGDNNVTPPSGSVVFSGTNIANIQTYTSPGSSTTLGQIYNYASIADGFARFLDVVAYSSTTGGGSNIRFVTGNGFTNAERVRIDSSGNVGVGTSSPVDLLTINRASGSGVTSGISLQTAAGSSGDGSYIKWTGAAAGEKVARIDGVQEGTDVGSIRFNTGNGADGFAERARIDSSGNLLVGTTSLSGPGANVVVGGLFRTVAGSGGLNNGQTVTLFSPATFTTYLVTAQTPNADGLSTTVLVHYPSGGNPIVKTTLVIDNAGFVITISGGNVQLTNNLGGVVGYTFSALRIF